MPVSDIPSLLDILRRGTDHLTAMAKGMDFPLDVDPAIRDPVKLHNMYARSLICCYISKFADLSAGILHAVDNSNFLVYALCGRSLLEITATLRYYVIHEYKPLFDKGAAGLAEPGDLQRIIQVDDRHLRGTRFNWGDFLFRNYAKLKNDAVAQLRDKRDKRRRSSKADENLSEQVNVQTCVDKWAQETPEALVAYNLFCDLVHPNFGSTFLVASRGEGTRFYFSRFRGTPIGRDIFEQSFPILMSLTHNPFAQHLTLLMGTIFPDREV
jgi:hypothetical protein